MLDYFSVDGRVLSVLCARVELDFVRSSLDPGSGLQEPHQVFWQGIEQLAGPVESVEERKLLISTTLRGAATCHLGKIQV